MALYKRTAGGPWWVRFTVRGRAARRSTGTDNREDAEEFETALRHRYWRQTHLGEQVHTWRDAVARRRSLAYGKLHDSRTGLSCAIGSFWDDNPKTTLPSDLIDEVAAVNDSLPPSATPHQRWKKVNSWLRWKINVMAGKRA